MGNYAAYAEYKDSGVEWLGEIPAAWGIVALSYLCRIFSGGTPDRNNIEYWEGNIPWVKTGEVNYNYITETEETITELGIKNSSASLAPPGTLLMAMYGQGNTRGRVAILGIESAFNQACLAILPDDKIVTRFLYFYLTASYEFMRDAGNESSQMNLSAGVISKIKIALPPFPEQQTIARFLDYKTAQIDALMAKKEALLTRLAAKRTALISQAVTKGLDPTVPMKDSGIEWLGEIPAHWEVRKLGHVARVVRGQTPRPAGDPAFFFGDVLPWITVGEVTKDNDKFVTSTQTMLTEAGVERSIIFVEGTLVLSNSGATLGVPKILGLTGCMNDGIAALLNIKSDMSKDFMYYFLGSLTTYLRDYMQGSGQPNLNTTIIAGISLSVPSYKEQVQIAEFIDHNIESIKQSEEKIAAAINKLKEYRTALITNAVTGKIDVRTVPIPPPSEVPHAP